MSIVKHSSKSKGIKDLERFIKFHLEFSGRLSTTQNSVSFNYPLNNPITITKNNSEYIIHGNNSGIIYAIKEWVLHKEKLYFRPKSPTFKDIKTKFGIDFNSLPWTKLKASSTFNSLKEAIKYGRSKLNEIRKQYTEESDSESDFNYEIIGIYKDEFPFYFKNYHQNVYYFLTFEENLEMKGHGLTIFKI